MTRKGITDAPTTARYDSTVAGVSVQPEPCEGCGQPAVDDLLCGACRSRRRPDMPVPDRVRLGNFAHYGLTEAQYLGLYEEQRHACAICCRHAPHPSLLVVDHNHANGEVRGLLCGPCNTALGLLQDSPAVLDAALDYLEERGHYGLDELATRPITVREKPGMAHHRWRQTTARIAKALQPET